MSSPGTDVQYISAGKACLDQGDYDCAAKNFAKVSPSDVNDQAQDTAYMLLDQNGADFAGFVDAFVGDGKGGGGGLTSLGTHISQKGGASGEAKRVALANAVVQSQNITGNPSLKGLVQFLTATALSGEILSELAGSDGSIPKTAIALNPTACVATAGVCALPATLPTPLPTPIAGVNGGDPNPCSPPTGTIFTRAGATTDIVATSPTSTNPSLEQFFSAITYSLSGLSAVGSGGSSFSATSSTLKTLSTVDIETNTPTEGTGDRCLRYEILVVGIGT
jgi:hypothetical protein